MLRSILRPFIPPIVLHAKNYIRRLWLEKDIFRGNGALFKRAVGQAKVYGEYGCGASTVWVAENTTLPIHTVDTSAEWIEYVRGKVKNRSDIALQVVDLGDLGDWGRPLGYEKRDHIRAYVEKIWTGETKPDVILIDGRFRVACMLCSLLNAKSGDHILFDDYSGREHYRLVEEFAPVSETCGDQALFLVPDTLDRAAIKKELEHFLYVME